MVQKKMAFFAKSHLWTNVCTAVFIEIYLVLSYTVGTLLQRINIIHHLLLEVIQ